jgi:uncharacterized membrane protein YkvA (DUF1232 family)
MDHVVSDLQATLAAEAPGVDVGPLAELLEPYLASRDAAIATLTALTKDPRVGRAAEFAAGRVLLYLADPDDLLPDDELGSLGLLDDTYFVHACLAAFHRTSAQLDFGGYEPPDERTRAAVRLLLPAGVADALDRTSVSLATVSMALFGARDGSQSASPREHQPLRVGEAAASLR